MQGLELSAIKCSTVLCLCTYLHIPDRETQALVLRWATVHLLLVVYRS